MPLCSLNPSQPHPISLFFISLRVASPEFVTASSTETIPESLEWSGRCASFPISSQRRESRRDSSSHRQSIVPFCSTSPESAKLSPPPSAIVTVDHPKRIVVSLWFSQYLYLALSQSVAPPRRVPRSAAVRPSWRHASGDKKINGAATRLITLLFCIVWS
jgi:hypothetical protein